MCGEEFVVGALGRQGAACIKAPRKICIDRRHAHGIEVGDVGDSGGDALFEAFDAEGGLSGREPASDRAAAQPLCEAFDFTQGLTQPALTGDARSPPTPRRLLVFSRHLSPSPLVGPKWTVSPTFRFSKLWTWLAI